MDIRGIDHINLTVADFEATVAWYGRVFGFALVEEGDQDGTRWGVIRKGDTMLCIYEFPGCELQDRHQLRERGLHGINHFGLRITDRAAWQEVLESHNLSVLYGGPIRWGASTSWYIQDPTGYELEIALWDDDTVKFG